MARRRRARAAKPARKCVNTITSGNCADLLRTSIQELGLSARAHDKVLRVARTIADLDGRAEIMAEHVSEAVNYRVLDRQFWS